jgi:hypothetical protein
MNTTDAELGETILQRLNSQVENIDKELGACPDNSMLRAAKVECTRMKSKLYESLCKFYARATL